MGAEGKYYVECSGLGSRERERVINQLRILPKVIRIGPYFSYRTGSRMVLDVYEGMDELKVLLEDLGAEVGEHREE
ncbi:MAG: hypothetical protein CMH63_00250 [Nanoarchaeota archaeon]|jgi:hypothetical protein|nr:hypothetical protein [Nanoarchaeota archaeon]|tara:strand:- start:25364 stop:25591 length:228 start_codon:yes stop_codon:yes gene_type:complete